MLRRVGHAINRDIGRLRNTATRLKGDYQRSAIYDDATCILAYWRWGLRPCRIGVGVGHLFEQADPNERLRDRWRRGWNDNVSERDIPVVAKQRTGKSIYGLVSQCNGFNSDANPNSSWRICNNLDGATTISGIGKSKGTVLLGGGGRDARSQGVSGLIDIHGHHHVRDADKYRTSSPVD